ncbi:hypothetical protein BZA77DRAFT_238145 [Pyronema omphalodes]|nr:hypothetical protein BZA77DRAFT_238145 [Pyronema omphalodes]
MPLLNPYLRAFFRSTLPAQCTPVHDYILLVPTTEILTNTRDRESGSMYSDLVTSDEFLGSHVLRIPNNTASTQNVGGRETRGKAKQFTTINGRTVVVKDTYVYSNKGFRNLNQAQLLHDTLHYPDEHGDPEPFLIYFISKPLIGQLEHVSTIPPYLRERSGKYIDGPPTSGPSAGPSRQSGKKKDVRSFNELLMLFPMIARQMQPGLEKLFHEFEISFQKYKPLQLPPPSPASSRSGRSGSVNSAVSGDVYKQAADESEIRRSLEAAITAAADLFQRVDQAQLDLLASTTDLTGAAVDRLIERYVAEQLHDTTLFPRLCATQAAQDEELEQKVLRMSNVDLTQVGIPSFETQEKKSLAKRVARGITSFEKIGAAKSPHAMVEHLLDTARTLTKVDDGDGDNKNLPAGEKALSMVTMNADMLVSLLLIVVIRAKVPHLHACLSYMRNFVFVEDVEQGEIGYILSTLEAVLFHILQDHTLTAASRANDKLWRSVRQGNIKAAKKILEKGKPTEEQPSSGDASDEDDSLISGIDGISLDNSPEEEASDIEPSNSPTPEKALPEKPLPEIPAIDDSTTMNGDIEDTPEIKPRSRKSSVSSMATISDLSVSSMVLSRTGTNQSQARDACNPEKLSKTRNPQGESILMMAIHQKKSEMLRYLLGTSFFDANFILEDISSDGATLLSAAVQAQDTASINLLLIELFRLSDDVLERYLRQTDVFGRTVAHYLFCAPDLISRLGRWLPWRKKDKNGQTPLFALCRSYDHPNYREMVGKAIKQAQATQQDQAKLHIDEHIDARGNSLLHIAGDPAVVRMLLRCDGDVNAVNDKGFTPLMVASKYGRVEMVRTFFNDARVDLLARELRGLTAVELAKDDDVRNRIDDLVLFQNPPGEGGRVTAVVRSFFVEDASIRVVLKSGAPSGEDSSTFTVMTCRRSIADFQFLEVWLKFEHPASWLPKMNVQRSPYQIPSKPSRAVLRDIQLRVNNFLRTLLTHPTFGTHELLWEFFLVPEMQQNALMARSRKKVEAREDYIRDEFAPIEDTKEVEMFVSFARESVRSIRYATASATRRATVFKYAMQDLPDAFKLLTRHLSGFKFLSNTPHLTALHQLTTLLTPSDSHPYSTFIEDLRNQTAALQGIHLALSRPGGLIAGIHEEQKIIDQHLASLRRNDRWPLGIMDDTRARYQEQTAKKAQFAMEQKEKKAQELRYTQSVAASELAAFHEERVKVMRGALKGLARRMVVLERERLEGLERVIRGVRRVIEE